MTYLQLLWPTVCCIFGLVVGRYVLGRRPCEEPPKGRTIELGNQVLYWQGLVKLLEEFPAARIVIEDCTVRDVPAEAIKQGADMYLTCHFGAHRGIVQLRNRYIQEPKGKI